jgi:hypothetical protein
MLIMLITNVLIFSQKKAQSVEYGFFICISEKINTCVRHINGGKVKPAICHTRHFPHIAGVVTAPLIIALKFP